MNAVEREPDPEVRAALWLKLLTKMTTPDLLGLRWKAVRKRVAIGPSGARYSLHRHVPRILASLPRYKGNPSVLPSLGLEISRYRFRRAWRRVRDEATLLNDSFSAVSNAVREWFQRRDGPDWERYDRVAADQEPGRLYDLVPRASEVTAVPDAAGFRRFEWGIVVMSIDDDELDNLIGWLGRNSDELEDPDSYKNYVRESLGHILAALPIKDVDKLTSKKVTKDHGDQIQRVKAKAEQLLRALDQAGPTITNDVARHGFSDAEQQMIAISKPATALNTGEGREALHTLQRMFEDTPHNSKPTWNPSVSPISSLLDALVDACEASERERVKKARPGARSKGKRDLVIGSLADWFLSNAVRDSLEPLKTRLLYFLQECLELVDQSLSLERISEIVAPQIKTLQSS